MVSSTRTHAIPRVCRTGGQERIAELEGKLAAYITGGMGWQGMGLALPHYSRAQQPQAFAAGAETALPLPAQQSLPQSAVLTNWLCCCSGHPATLTPNLTLTPTATPAPAPAPAPTPTPTPTLTLTLTLSLSHLKNQTIRTGKQGQSHTRTFTALTSAAALAEAVSHGASAEEDLFLARAALHTAGVGPSAQQPNVQLESAWALLEAYQQETGHAVPDTPLMHFVTFFLEVSCSAEVWGGVDAALGGVARCAVLCMPHPGAASLASAVKCSSFLRLFFLAGCLPASLQSLSRGAPQLADMLIQRYRRSLGRDPSLLQLAVKCREAHLGAQPQASMGGLLGDMMRMLASG
jgi:hypothetical protein